MSKLGDEPAYPIIGKCDECDGRGVNDQGMCVSCNGIGHLCGGGCTKRELFTAMAMQGLCANSGFNREMIEEESIDCADATLAELAKEGDHAEPA